MTIASSIAAYLLDTNTVSYLLDARSPFCERVRANVEATRNDSTFLLSILSYYELSFSSSGLHLGGNWLEELQETLIEDELAPVPLAGANTFCRLKAGLSARTGAKPAALVRHNVDLMLAATALASNLTLVSNDSLFRTLAEIEPSLRIEDWTKA